MLRLREVVARPLCRPPPTCSIGHELGVQAAKYPTPLKTPPSNLAASSPSGDDVVVDGRIITGEGCEFGFCDGIVRFATDSADLF